MSGKHLQRLNARVLSLYLGKYNDPGAYFLLLQTNTFSPCHNTPSINPFIYTLLKYNRLDPSITNPSLPQYISRCHEISCGVYFLFT